jgi:DHA1 family bicyclomycin/chloramphenicol resistance-like MFS transporter
MALAPLVAPVIGGVLQTMFGWRSNFIALLCFSMMAWCMVWFLLPETLRQRTPEFSLSSTVRSFGRFLADRSFVVHLGVVACCMAGLFAWISTAAFVLQNIYGLTPLAFGLSFTIASSGYLIGTSIAARFVMHWGSGRTMGLGTAAMALGGIAMMIHVAAGSHAGIALTLTAGLYMIGMGMALPQAQAGALLPFPDRAGAAASLLGFCTQTSSAVVGAVLGHLLSETAWPLAIAMTLAGGIGLMLWTLSRGIRAQANPH